MKGRYTYRFSLMALVLLASALRLYHLDVQSLWYDEGVTAQVARMDIRALVRWTADDIQPPLYYLLVAGWLRIVEPWAGSLAYTLRWLSAAWGVLLVPLTAALARRLWGRRAALWAAGVTATAPVMVYYGQEARMYTLLVLWVTGSAYTLVRWRQAEQADV
ncbi:MAG: glycosyltransferase family 39 protein, partial [Caldilineales bacterium]|nr:glycosyltransferase family 39 protein [Caldilineales bacterium]